MHVDRITLNSTYSVSNLRYVQNNECGNNSKNTITKNYKDKLKMAYIFNLTYIQF